MKYTPNYSYKQPERTPPNDDPADINSLSGNWGEFDKTLNDVSGIQATAQALASTHTANMANPHGTTAEQLGAYTRVELDGRDGSHATHVVEMDNPHGTTTLQVGAYSMGETDALLAGKLRIVEELGANLVLVTNTDGEAVTATVTDAELAGLQGTTGNIQEQLNNVVFYNYFPGLPIITMALGGDVFPPQPAIDAQVIPLLEEAYPEPARHDAVIQNVQTQNGTQRKAVLYSYCDGTQHAGYVGWRYVTEIDTVLNQADGGVYGIARSSGDISFLAGEGTVHHAAEADKAAVAHGLESLQQDEDIGTEDIPFRNVYAETLHSPQGYAILRAQGTTASLAGSGEFCPGVNGTQDIGTSAAAWRSGCFTGGVSAAKSFTLNGNTITGWPVCTHGKRYATYVVGTTQSGHTEADCDYLCDGTADQVEINAAIAVVPVMGGKVLVLEGKYYFTDRITIAKNNVILQGAGKGTVFDFTGGVKLGYAVYSTGTYCTIRDFQLYATKDITYGVATVNHGVTIRGLYIDGSTSGISVTGNDCTVDGNRCVNNTSGIAADTKNGAVVNNTCVGLKSSYGIFITGNANSVAVTGNCCTNYYYGIFVSGYNVTVTGNACNSNQIGVYNTNYYSVIAGNNLWNNESALYDGGNVSAKGLNGGAS